MKKIFLLLISVLLFSCGNDKIELNKKFVNIKLVGDLSERALEASGLSWYKGNLIILPQFPHKWDEQFDGAIYFVSRKRIDNFLSGKDTSAIEGEKLSFVAKGLDSIGKARGSGYEAIAFMGDSVFVTIESIGGKGSTSYIVKGIMDFNNKKLVLDSNTKQEIISQTDIHNMGEETMLLYNNSIYTIHEANGLNVNSSPFAAKFSSNLLSREKVNIPNIDYRITDATEVDSTGKFYVINYYYPGEFKKLKPMLSDKKKDNAIEQIVEFQILDSSIIKTPKEPLQISNSIAKNGNNWEGIVKYGNGFLIITDMFPETILAYVKNE